MTSFKPRFVHEVRIEPDGTAVVSDERLDAILPRLARKSPIEWKIGLHMPTGIEADEITRNKVRCVAMIAALRHRAKQHPDRYSLDSVSIHVTDQPETAARNFSITKFLPRSGADVVISYQTDPDGLCPNTGDNPQRVLVDPTPRSLEQAQAAWRRFEKNARSFSVDEFLGGYSELIERGVEIRGARSNQEPVFYDESFTLPPPAKREVVIPPVQTPQIQYRPTFKDTGSQENDLGEKSPE